eukprot:13668255-Alexandrium_andersonii.AAC.1
MAPSGASREASTLWRRPSGRARTRSSRTSRVMTLTSRSSVRSTARMSPRRATSSSSESRSQ